MADTITSLDVLDVRLDTSSTLVGSDAMNPIPDYSAAYLILRTSGEHDGHALVFTIGEGTELQVAAIRALQPLVKGLAADLGPYWAEEPTSPDDVLGHARIRREVAPVKVATGEHAHSRVMFKQLLQAGGLDVVNLDACRVAGINENVAILLLAARFGAAVCPHAGGVGLCEMVQHLAMFDYVAVRGTLEGRVLEYADHLHEHFRSRW